MNCSVPHIRRSRGFTLLELILVMLILCITLGLSGPSLRGFFAMRKLDDTGAKMVSLMEYARTKAICDGRIYRFYISPRNRTYWLSVLEKDEYVELGTEWGVEFKIPDEFDVEIRDLLLDHLDHYVEFTGSGRLLPGSIEITDAKGEKLNIVCRSASERFMIVDDQELKDYEAGRN